MRGIFRARQFMEYSTGNSAPSTRNRHQPHILGPGRPKNLGLSGSQLGLTRVRWSFEKGEARFEVLGIALAMLSPARQKFELAPEQVLLTPAHEMGHALGLPHSDSEQDVIYPKNTARNLSSRDFRTVDALYCLPNGAKIEKNP